MLPQIKNGDYAVLLKVTRFITPRVGVNVIFDHPEYGTLLKQVSSVDKNKQSILVHGLNTLSVTQEQIGAVAFSSIKGYMLWNFSNRRK